MSAESAGLFSPDSEHPYPFVNSWSHRERPEFEKIQGKIVLKTHVTGNYGPQGALAEGDPQFSPKYSLTTSRPVDVLVHVNYN